MDFPHQRQRIRRFYLATMDLRKLTAHECEASGLPIRQFVLITQGILILLAKSVHEWIR